MTKKIEEYTEKAIRLLGGSLPELCYLPPGVRNNKLRVTPNGAITKAPPTVQEQMDRILEADPLGFLIAVMNGQPILTFNIKQKAKEKYNPHRAGRNNKKPVAVGTIAEEGSLIINAEFHAPSAADRERVAMYLNNCSLPKPAVRNAANRKAEQGESVYADPAYEAMVRNRAQQVNDG